MGRKHHDLRPLAAGVESDNASLGHMWNFVEWFLFGCLAILCVRSAGVPPAGSGIVSMPGTLASLHTLGSLMILEYLPPKIEN
jgi:hypothetical protein